MTTTQRIAAAAPAGPSGRSETWPLQACLLLNVIAAGVPGTVLLVAPDLAPSVAGAAADPAVARLVGAIWLAIGVVSLLGLSRPLDLRGVLAVQVVYKSVYVLAVGVPAILAGSAAGTAIGLTAGFTMIVALWTAALVRTRTLRR